MDKKLIVGGLALVGGIALVAYLLKPKAPRRNSEGFFGATGMSSFYQQTSDRNKSQFNNANGKTIKAYYKR